MTDSSHDPLVVEVRRVVFTTARMREGYDMTAVDDLLEVLARAVEESRPVGPVVDRVRFPTTRFRDGYDPSEVDHFLSWLVAEQSKRTDVAPAPPDTDAAPDVAEQHAEPLPSVIEEPPGLLARLFGRG